MSYFRICSMRSIQKTTFCGFIALLNKVLDFGGQLANKFRFILVLKYSTVQMCNKMGKKSSSPHTLSDLVRKSKIFTTLPLTTVLQELTLRKLEQTN